MPRRRRQVAKALAGVPRGSVLDHYTEKYGVTKGAWRAAHMVQIALVVQDFGRDFGNGDYIKYWGVDETTGWNHRREAREVYGDAWRDVAEHLAKLMAEQNVRSPAAAQRIALA